ncbi:MAG: T9SS type A sorting domain-containing protein [Bacteroidota bacterium]
MKRFYYFIAILFSAGVLHAQSLVWVKTYGGNSLDNATRTVTDAAGNVYTIGLFMGTSDLDPGTGTFNVTAAGNWDIYVQKLSSSGSFIWAKAFGGTSSESASSIAVDASGNIYLCGYFQGAVDFDPGAASVYISATGNNNAFLEKLDASGNFVWVKTFSSSIGGELGAALGLDAAGNIYFTGQYWLTVDFDPGSGVANLNSAGMGDVFITKFTPAGNLVWAKSAGGPGQDAVNDMEVSSTGKLYLVGNFDAGGDFDPGPGVSTLSTQGGKDIFIFKLDSTGAFVWAGSMGSNLNDEGNSLDIDPFENVYSIGVFRDTVDFDPGSGVSNAISQGSEDIFVQKLNSSGALVWAKTFGGTGVEVGYGISADMNGNVYTTGEFDAPGDYDPGPGTVTLTPMGGADAFIQRLDNSGNYVWAYGLGGNATDFGYAAHADQSGNVFFSGSFLGTVDFDPGPGTSSQTAGGTFGNAFIQKLNSTVGMEEVTPDPVDCYPNPTSGVVNVIVNVNGEARIINSLGEEAGRWELEAGENRINLSALLPGVYFIVFTSENGVITRKVIKE